MERSNEDEVGAKGNGIINVQLGARKVWEGFLVLLLGFLQTGLLYNPLWNTSFSFWALMYDDYVETH